MQNFCLSDAIIERFHEVENELGFSEHVLKLDCNAIDAWEFREHNSLSSGTIDELALSIQTGGQCQPILVVKASDEFRPKHNLLAQYVIISGYRRWMACKKAQIKVQALVKDISFEQAITIFVTENEKEHIPDYTKGLFYSALLAKNKISIDDLSRQLNLNANHLKNYLSFAQIPSQLWEAMGDVSKVSHKTAAILLMLCQKGAKYQKALIEIADKIAQGYGEKRILKAVDAVVNKNKSKEVDHKIKFDGKIISDLHHGRIKLDNSLVNNDHFNELISTLEKDILEFAKVYLKNK